MGPRGQVAIVGVGSLGSSIAFALVMRQSVSEILLVDLSTELLQGQVLDLNQASFGTSTLVRAGTLKEAGQSDVVIMTADSPRRNNEPRSEWIKRNLLLYQSIAAAMLPIRSKTIIMTACEPVDILTLYLQNSIPLPAKQIFGIGTITLTAARVQEWFTTMSGVGKASKVRSYVLGNADVPVIAWHDAKINGQPAKNFPVLEEHRALAEQLVSWNRMQHLEASKGGAWFGFAATLTRLTEAVLIGKKPSIHVLSVYVDRFRTCVSVPVTVAAGGIQELVDVDLSKEEEMALEKAAEENAQETSAVISLIGPLKLS